MYKILMCVFCPHCYKILHHGFIDNGCEVQNLFIDDSYMYKTERLVADLNKVIDKFKPDLVFTYGWWKINIDIDQFMDVINKRGLFHVWWGYDDQGCLYEISMPVARRSDLVFTTYGEALPEYHRNGINAKLMMLGCYPPIHKKVPVKSEYQHDFSLIAAHHDHSFRIKGVYDVLKPLVDKEYDVIVYGRWWDEDRGYLLPEKFWGGWLPEDDVSALHSSSKITLAIQGVGDSNTMFAVRTLEAMSSGAFHLTQWSPAIEIFFKKGIHLEWSKSPEETLEIAEFYLKHGILRERIALQGQQEVHARHSIVQRAKEALEVIKKYKT